MRFRNEMAAALSLCLLIGAAAEAQASIFDFFKKTEEEESSNRQEQTVERPEPKQDQMPEKYEPYSLTEQLKEKKAASAAKIDPETAAIMQKTQDDLTKLDFPLHSVQEGDRVPEFTLPNVDGEMVSINRLYRAGPVVLTFFRGSWCMYCNLELHAYERAFPEIQKRGAQLVAIAPEVQPLAKENVEENRYSFDVLVDEGNKVAKVFGLVFTLPEELNTVYKQFGIDLEKSNGDTAHELPVPATYIIDSNGIIVKRFVDPDYRKRMDPSDVLTELDNLRD